MGQYIPKSALAAELERRKKKNLLNESAFEEDIDMLSFLNTIEAKEVDLEKEMDKEWGMCLPIDEGMGLEIATIEHEQFDNIAKHFFELGP